MTLTEWLLVALVAISSLALTLAFLSYIYLSQINDMIAAFLAAYGNQPARATEATQREAVSKLDSLETMTRNWRNGR